MSCCVDELLTLDCCVGDNWQHHLRLLDPQSQQALLHVDEQEASEVRA